MGEIKDITLWDAKLYFHNFSGIARGYDEEGNRNFGVFISEDDAERLSADGWNVKRAKPDEDGYQRPFLKVKINLKGRPKLYKVTSKNKTLLDEVTMNDLDRDIFERIDLKIRHPYLEKYGTYGTYLDKGFFTVVEDDLDRAYFNNGPDISADSFEMAEDDIPFK